MWHNLPSVDWAPNASANKWLEEHAHWPPTRTTRWCVVSLMRGLADANMHHALMHSADSGTMVLSSWCTVLWPGSQIPINQLLLNWLLITFKIHVQNWLSEDNEHGHWPVLAIGHRSQPTRRFKGAVACQPNSARSAPPNKTASIVDFLPIITMFLQTKDHKTPLDFMTATSLQTKPLTPRKE